MAARPNKTRIRRALRSTAPKEARASIKVSPARTAEALIPWGAPELGPALDSKIDLAWAGWATAADFAPDLEDAPVVARLLQALREARRLGDQKALGMLDAGARAALDQVAPAIAAETHARYAAEGTLAPGVTIADLMPRQLQRNGAGRKGDRRDAAASLAEGLDRYLTRPSRFSASNRAPLPTMSAREMAEGFVHALAPHAGPIGRELKRCGLVPVDRAASYGADGLLPGSILDVKIKAVTAAFTKHLRDAPRSTSSQRWWLWKGESRDTASTGKDLVRVGLRALGLPAKYVKNLFSSAG